MKTSLVREFSRELAQHQGSSPLVRIQVREFFSPKAPLMSVNVLTTCAEKEDSQTFSCARKICETHFFCQSLFPSALFPLEKFAQKSSCENSRARKKCETHFFCRSLFPSALFLLEKFAQKVRARTQSSREKSSRENCVNSVKRSREKSSRENSVYAVKASNRVRILTRKVKRKIT